MSYKRKKTDSASAKRYTTRQIMEITEQRRLKDTAPAKEIETKAKAPENEPAPVIEEVKQPVKQPINQVVEAAEDEVEIPAKSIAGIIILVLLIIMFFLVVSSKNSGSWVDPVVDRLNALIVDGSFCVLNILQGASVQGVVLKTHYYKLSLQGDLAALYSLELLIAFAALFIFFHRAEWNKWGKVFIALVPLAVIANIFRVVMAFGFALNYGTTYANRCFHGVLVGLVFAIIVLGLMFFEFLSSSD